MAAKKQRIRPGDAVMEWDVDLSEGSVLLRRTDLMNEVLSGKLETRLVDTAVKLQELNQTALSALDAITAMAPHERADTLYLFRAYACVAIKDPVYVMEPDTGDPAHVSIETLSNNDLLLVWNAAPPTHVQVDPDQPLVAPGLEGPGDPARFPAGAPAEPRAAASPVEPLHPGEDLPHATLRATDDRVVAFTSA